MGPVEAEFADNTLTFAFRVTMKAPPKLNHGNGTLSFVEHYRCRLNQENSPNNSLWCRVRHEHDDGIAVHQYEGYLLQ